jgi:CPA2 family monovalent cation:H+ antiporter-2
MEEEAFMSEETEQTAARTIIAGYGVPGRAVAEVLRERGVPYCIVELNPTTVHRCEKGHVPIIEGDCTDPGVLERAGIHEAALFVVMIPNEHAAVQATDVARKLNPSIRIITRCHYTSTGIEAKTRGANDVVVSEIVVAAEVARLLASDAYSSHP